MRDNVKYTTANKIDSPCSPLNTCQFLRIGSQLTFSLICRRVFIKAVFPFQMQNPAVCTDVKQENGTDFNFATSNHWSNQRCSKMLTLQVLIFCKNWSWHLIGCARKCKFCGAAQWKRELQPIEPVKGQSETLPQFD